MPIFLGTGDGPPVPVAIPGAVSAHVWDGVWRQVWSAFTLQPDVIMMWSTAGSHTLELPAYQCEVDVLVVGGGGGGGQASGGLGGIKVSTIAHDGGVSVPVVIGVGGAGGSFGGNGRAGGASSILGVSAAGGAGGTQSGGAAEKRHSTGHVAHGVSHNLYPYGWGGAGDSYEDGKAGGPGYVWVRIRDARTGPTPP